MSHLYYSMSVTQLIGPAINTKRLSTFHLWCTHWLYWLTWGQLVPLQSGTHLPFLVEPYHCYTMLLPICSKDKGYLSRWLRLVNKIAHVNGRKELFLPTESSFWHMIYSYSDCATWRYLRLHWKSQFKVSNPAQSRQIRAINVSVWICHKTYGSSKS